MLSFSMWKISESTRGKRERHCNLIYQNIYKDTPVHLVDNSFSISHPSLWGKLGNQPEGKGSGKVWNFCTITLVLILAGTLEHVAHA